QALTITTPQLRINALAQDDVLFSTQYWFQGTPTIHWRFMSLWRTQDIAVWQPDVYENISEPYKDRLYTYYNGSIMLLDVGVKDSGFYVMTVTEPSGISKDSIIILKVFEKLYEDLPFLIVFGTVLASIAGLFMVLMWFLDKTVHLVKRRRKQRGNIYFFNNKTSADLYTEGYKIIAVVMQYLLKVNTPTSIYCFLKASITSHKCTFTKP
ncbi:VSTM5 protein, partial [Amia calva]|nr:VSTM5 protein [Amia calva]